MGVPPFPSFCSRCRFYPSTRPDSLTRCDAIVALDAWALAASSISSVICFIRARIPRQTACKAWSSRLPHPSAVLRYKARPLATGKSQARLALAQLSIERRSHARLSASTCPLSHGRTTLFRNFASENCLDFAESATPSPKSSFHARVLR